MESSVQERDSLPVHLTRSTDRAQESRPQLVEVNLQENCAGLESKLGCHILKELQWSSSLDKRRHQDPGNDLIVKQLEFSWFEKYVTFYRLHMAYFIVLGGLGALGMYVLPLSDSRRLSFVDSMYTSFSAMCGTGFQTVRSQDLTWMHNFVILILMNLGAPVLVSLLPLYVRRFYFHLCIKQIYHERCKAQGKLVHLSKAVRLELNYAGELVEQELGQVGLSSPSFDDDHSRDSTETFPIEVDSSNVENVDDEKLNIHIEHQDENWGILVGAEQALRTLEYRALTTLSWLVISFFFGAQIIGFLLGAIYFRGSPGDANIPKGMYINPTVFAFFTAVSTFTNGGYNINNDGMMALKKSSFLLILYTILASLGNTLYAPFMRVLVWICYHLVGEKSKVVYKYLLRHPRRCSTNLFPRSHTVWLVFIFIACTSLQLIFLCTLEWNEALGGMTTLDKLIAGIYQTVGTRNAGGNVIELYRIAPAILFVFVVMMYISAYPNFLFLQTSADNYDDTELSAPSTFEEKMNPSQWRTIVVIQSRRLLARDTSYLFFAILFLCLSENARIKRDPLNFSIFNIVFEVVSAYGSIGLSIGYHCDLEIDKTSPCEKVPYSFSGTWTSIGKLIVVVIMFLGRHRGLPDNIDSAIQLPATKPVAPVQPQTPRRSFPDFPCSNASSIDPLSRGCAHNTHATPGSPENLSRLHEAVECCFIREQSRDLVPRGDFHTSERLDSKQPKADTPPTQFLNQCGHFL